MPAAVLAAAFCALMSQPSSGSKPRALSSLYCWQSAHGSQQKWTQQSQQPTSGRPSYARILERYVQE